MAEFGGYVEEMLHDRLVCGVQDERIQCRLLSERDLDFRKAMEIAQGMEVAAKNATDIQVASSSLTPQGKEETVKKYNTMKNNSTKNSLR